MWEQCGGCQYEEFPYNARPPIQIEGEYKEKTFNNVEDVWSIIDLLIDEVKSFNESGEKKFDIAMSIKKQLSTFACIDCLYDNEIQRAIQRYMYCKDFNTPPYRGSYGEQPASWVNMCSIIKNVLAKREKNSIEDAKRK